MKICIFKSIPDSVNTCLGDNAINLINLDKVKLIFCIESIKINTMSVLVIIFLLHHHPVYSGYRQKLVSLFILKPILSQK